jgi:hypothetical protein
MIVAEVSAPLVMSLAAATRYTAAQELVVRLAVLRRLAQDLTDRTRDPSYLDIAAASETAGLSALGTVCAMMGKTTYTAFARAGLAEIEGLAEQRLQMPLTRNALARGVRAA